MAKRLIDKIAYDNIDSFLISHYKKRLKKNPVSKIFVPLSDAYRRDDQIVKAILVCEKGIKLYPNYISGRIMLGKAYYYAERLDEAETEFKKVITLSKKNISAHKYLYKIYIEKGNLSLTFIHLKKYIELCPYDTIAKKILSNIENRTDKAAEVDTSEETLEFILEGDAPSSEKIQESSGTKDTKTDSNDDDSYFSLEIPDNIAIPHNLDFNKIPYQAREEKKSPVAATPSQNISSTDNEKIIQVLEGWLKNIKDLKKQPR